MEKIRAICIDNKNRPKEIPLEKWIHQGQLYHINWIYKMVNQNGIQGVSLAEIDISNCEPYNCFRLTRFAININDLQNLFDLIKECTKFSDLDINKLIEELQTVEI